MKLIHTHYKLRQYIAIASKKQAQQLELGQEIEVTQRRGNDVPFGIRAIESGIEVDGVWISRPNTPLLDSPKSLAAPSIEASSLSSDTDPSNRVSSASNISRLEMPPPVRLYRASSPGRPKTSSRVQSFVGERVPSESSSLNTDPSVGRRPTYQPRHASYLGYSNPNIVRDSATMDALEGHRRDGSGSVRTSEGRSSSITAGLVL